MVCFLVLEVFERQTWVHSIPSWVSHHFNTACNDHSPCVELMLPALHDCDLDT